LLTIAIPVRDEAPTIGVLLWRIRSVFQEYPREYDVIVFNDGSMDGTAEVLAPYTKVLPLTVLGGENRVGYARALDTLLREAARRTRYPRRDAIVFMQGDLTDQPEHIPELSRRFEGGADVIVAERPVNETMPVTERRLRKFAQWTRRPLLAALETSDPFGTYRVIRLSIVRDLLKAKGDAPLLTNDGWAANVELLHAARSAARRVENVVLAPRYDLRPRETRRRLFADALALLRTGRDVRKQNPPSTPRAEPALSQ
jgi:glycosyltransferase involved in cell wall biosynthesis